MTSLSDGLPSANAAGTVTLVTAPGARARTALRPRIAAGALIGVLAGATGCFVPAALAQSRWLNEFKCLPDQRTDEETFGWRVAIDRDLILVSGIRSPEGPFLGAVYLWDAVTGERAGALQHPDGSSRYYFGCSFDVDGGRAIVGSMDTINGFEQAGAVFVYDLQSQALLHRFQLEEPAYRSQFGHDVAIDGGLAAVASSEWAGKKMHDGRLYFYDLDSGELVQQIVPGEPKGEPMSILAIDISEGRAVATAYRQKTARGVAFVVDIATGALTATLVPEDGQRGDGFGEAVALRGRLALIGSSESFVETDRRGAAYLFDVISETLVAKLVAPEGSRADLLGTSVAFNDRFAVLGAPNSDHLHRRRGAAYVFDMSTGGFVSKITEPDGVSQSDFGWSVAIDERSDRVAIGSPNDIVDEAECGSAYVARAMPVAVAATLEGSCPGKVVVTVTNATPGGKVALGLAKDLGATLLRSRTCPQLHVDLYGPPLAGTPAYHTADAMGVARFRFEVGANRCGRLFAQAIDVSTCEVSNLVFIAP